MLKCLLAASICLLGGMLMASPAYAQNCPVTTPQPASNTLFNNIHVASTVIDNGVVPDIDKAFALPLENYLNQRGTADLITTLNGIGSIAWDDFQAALKVQVFERDLTGDGVPEVLVMIDLNSGAGFSAGIFRYDCQNGQYTGGQIARTSGWRVEHGFDDSAPEIRALVDLTGDRLPEIVIFHVLNVGSNFDDAAYTVLDALGKSLGEISVENGNVDIRDFDQDGLSNIITRYPYYRSSDSFNWSRLGRDTETVWTWDGQTFTSTCSYALMPPSYRVQAVLDGGSALKCGKYSQAVLFYQQAIEDNTLLGWSQADNLCPGCDPAVEYDQWAVMAYEARQEGFSVPDVDERPRLSAYARYRLVATYAALNQTAEAEQALAQLEKDFPDGKVGHDYVPLAQAFWKSFQANGDLKGACQQVIDAAGQIESPLNTYSFTGVNVGIIDVKQEAICPF